MRVLYIPHDNDMFGGANYALLELIDTLSLHNSDYNAVVLVSGDNGELINELKIRKIKYIISKYNWWVYQKTSNPVKNIYRHLKVIYGQIKILLNIKKLVNQIKHEDIDIIHSNSSVINIGAWINKFAKIPHIWHVREFGEEHHNFTFLFGCRLSRRIMSICSDRIVLISEILLNKYINYVDKTNLILIYDGVSSKYDNPKVNNDCSDKEFVTIVTGTIHRGKGQIEAVRAVCKLLKKGFNVKLLLAGRLSDKSYFEEILNEIEKNNAEEKIKYIGEIKDVNSIRKKMKAEIVCSYMEAFGRVTIEGMLSMLPIVASNSGANSELIKHGYNGLIYKKGDIDDLASKIEQLYLSDKLCNEIGKNGYEYSKKHFTAELNAKNIYSLYESVINN